MEELHLTQEWDKTFPQSASVAVSYTHLDVYKRQPEERETRCREAARRFREAGAHFVLRTLADTPRLAAFLGG